MSAKLAIRAKCIQRIKDKHNVVIKYVLEDCSNGVTRVVESKQLKNAIANNKIEVTNLILTSDNRILYKEEITDELDKRIESLVNKANIMGKNIMVQIYNTEDYINVINTNENKYVYQVAY